MTNEKLLNELKNADYEGKRFFVRVTIEPVEYFGYFFDYLAAREFAKDKINEIKAMNIIYPNEIHIYMNKIPREIEFTQDIIKMRGTLKDCTLQF